MNECNIIHNIVKDAFQTVFLILDGWLGFWVPNFKVNNWPFNLGHLDYTSGCGNDLLIHNIDWSKYTKINSTYLCYGFLYWFVLERRLTPGLNDGEKIPTRTKTTKKPIQVFGCCASRNQSKCCKNVRISLKFNEFYWNLIEIRGKKI